MTAGCLNIFGGSRTNVRRRNLSNESVPTRSSSSIVISTKYSGIIRNDSGFGANSRVSTTSSTVSSRSNVSFNPKIESVVFDTSEAPSKIQLSPVTKSHYCVLPRTASRGFSVMSSPSPVYRQYPSVFQTGQLIERRHMR